MREVLLLMNEPFKDTIIELVILFVIGLGIFLLSKFFEWLKIYSYG